MCSEESVVKLGNMDRATIEQAEDHHVGNDCNAGSSVAHNNCQNIDDLFVDYAFEESLDQPVTKGTNDHGETKGTLLIYEPVTDMMQDPEVNQCQLRTFRSLQSEDSLHNIPNTPVSLNLTDSDVSSRSPANPMKSRSLDSSSMDIPATPSNMQLRSMTPSKSSSFSLQNNINSSPTVSKPLGIGLHLNSIVSTIPVASSPTSNVKSADARLLTGKNSLPVKRGLFENEKDYNEHIIENASAISEGCEREAAAYSPTKHSVHVRSAVTESIKHGATGGQCTETATEFVPSSTTNNRERRQNSGDGCRHCSCKLSKCLRLYCECFASGNYCAEPCVCQDCFNRPEYESTVLQQGTAIDQGKEVSKELIVSSTINRGKKRQNSGDGCRNCSCRMSRCLKLYCECFASGMYCSEPCACQGCFNRPECERTVIDSWKSIVSRNQAAFSPKTAQQCPQAPASISEGQEYIDQLTPLSRKIKIGCRCRKSMCQKKYCECYQVGVGCSDRCRCEGCKNKFGKKQASIKGSINEKLDKSFEQKLILEATKEPLSLSDHSPRNLTPPTPLYQSSLHGSHDTSKGTRLVFGSTLPSADSAVTLLICPISPVDHDMKSKTTKGTVSVSPYDPLDSEVNNSETMGELSRRSHGPAPSGKANEHPNNHHKTRDWMDEYQSPHGSPITPETLFDSPKLCQLDPQKKDNLPNTLEDSSAQIQNSKVRSPNKKRVTPPFTRLNELCSGSLTRGRKFILKSISSVPPTPDKISHIRKDS